jgi:hypothetical protein
MGIKIMSDAHLHPVKSSCRMTDASPLVQGKVHSPMMEQPLSRKAVSKEKTSSIELNIHHNAREPLPHGLDKTNEFLVACEESFESSKAAEPAKVEEQLDVNAMIYREDPNVHAPNHGEVSATTRLCVERNTVISTKDKSSTMKDSPIAKVALTLPIQSLTFYMRAEIPRLSRDESEPSFSMATEQKHINDVSPRTEINADAYRMVTSSVNPPTDLRLATTHKPGANPPTQGEAVPLWPPNEAATSTRRPAIEAVVNAKQSTQICLPAPKVARTLPSWPPMASIWATPARPPRDVSRQASMPVIYKQRDPTNVVSTMSVTCARARPTTISGTHTEVLIKTALQSGVVSPSPGETTTTRPPKEASLSMRRPKNETVINKEQMRSLRHLPVPLTARLRPRPPPASSVQDRPSHLSNDEPRQPRLVVPKPVPPIKASSSRPSKEEALATRRSKDKAKLITLLMSRSQRKLNETAVSKRQVRRPQSLPDASLARLLPKSLPIQQLQAAPIRPPNDKLCPPVGMTSTRAQASIHPGEVGKE